MSMGKDMAIPSKLFMVDRDAVNAMPVAALIVVLFSVLITHFLTISVYLLVMLFIFVGSTKIVVTRDLINTAMIMLTGVFIMAYSYDVEPVITFPMEPPVQSSNITSMLLTCVICFVVFIQGYFYSFTVKSPLRFLRYVYLYPYLIRKKIIYKMFFLSFIIILLLSIFVYALSGFDFASASDISVKYFGGKGQAPGRDLMWPELLLYILDKPLFGYGINQDSGFLRSSAAVLGYRGLDSHNIYLESLLRGGILLLSFFIILFYRIWGSLYSINNNKMSRIAASGFMALLFLGAGIPIGLLDNIVLNALLWFFWGVASGNTWINNHQHVAPPYFSDR